MQGWQMDLSDFSVQWCVRSQVYGVYLEFIYGFVRGMLSLSLIMEDSFLWERGICREE